MTGEAIVGLVAILVTVLFQALYVSYKMGKFEEKLAEIDKKQDKHNNLIWYFLLPDHHINIWLHIYIIIQSTYKVINKVPK